MPSIDPLTTGISIGSKIRCLADRHEQATHSIETGHITRHAQTKFNV